MFKFYDCVIILLFPFFFIKKKKYFIIVEVQKKKTKMPTSYTSGNNTGTTINPSGIPPCFYTLKVKSQKCKNQMQQYCNPTSTTHKQCVDELEAYCQNDPTNPRCSYLKSTYLNS